MDSTPEAEPELRRRVRQQEVVAELGQQALETDDLDGLMRDASVAVAETLGNEYAKVLELLPDGDEVILRQGVGWRDGLVGAATAPTVLDSQAGYTLVTDEPVIVDDLRTEDRFSGPELLTSHDVVSGISVVVGSVENPWGVLGTHTTAYREFTDHDATFVKSVANILGTAIENDQTETELEESERRYRTLIEHFPNGAVALVDENLRYRTVGGDPLEVAGRTIEEVEDSRVQSLPPELADELVPRYEAALEGESSTFEVRTGDRVYDIRIVPIRDDDGEISSALGMSQDVTERDEYERQLEESERRYRTLVENFPNGAVGLFDWDLRYTAVGGQLLDTLSIDPENRIGKTILELHPDDLVEDIEPHFRAALDGEATSFDVELGDRHLHAHTLPVGNTRGDVFAGMVVVQDDTERRDYQRKLEASNERLEQFAYAASHDLQEPLRMVTSYLQLLESRYGDCFGEDGEAFLEFAVDGAERMRAMIDALLEYSRVESRGDPFEPVDLNAAFDDALADLQLTVDESDAEITTGELPEVAGDTSQLRQVFQNLLSNAITYSGDDPPRVRVSAEQQGDEWVLSVRDEGIGIDPADHDRVFTVFNRLHSREEYEGTGIGLALCRRIVERHGGDIWIDSAPGDGATVSFTVPAESELDA
ncbi:ATP-binding protein [Natrinema salinisoli]|uniref:ATP-binding protein n=1 Tax=Natrinema salinisoli TaxID=2878535 RepID=UPI001CF03082|nr:ATP-binding protein [Natrinema salinisoli]